MNQNYPRAKNDISQDCTTLADSALTSKNSQVIYQNLVKQRI